MKHLHTPFLEEKQLRDDSYVTVCSNCLMAACWQGIFCCDAWETAGTVQKTVKELRALQLEDEHYWTNEVIYTYNPPISWPR